MQELTAVIFKQLQVEADQGSMQAQYDVANAYYRGNGTTQNPQLGAKWLKKAAEQGHIGAQCDLGVMYQTGNGVEQDYRAILKWFRMAAEQGDAIAQHNLGIIYAKGFQQKGVSFFNPTAFAFMKATQNFVEAYKWFTLAAANCRELALKDRAIIKMRMTAEQISKAERLSQEYMQKT